MEVCVGGVCVLGEGGGSCCLTGSAYFTLLPSSLKAHDTHLVIVKDHDAVFSLGVS